MTTSPTPAPTYDMVAKIKECYGSRLAVLTLCDILYAEDLKYHAATTNLKNWFKQVPESHMRAINYICDHVSIDRDGEITSGDIPAVLEVVDGLIAPRRKLRK